jgi:hypothetical protein
LWVLIFTLLRIFIGYGAILLVALIVRSWAKPLSDAPFLGDWTFDFSPLGIRIHRPTSIRPLREFRRGNHPRRVARGPVNSRSV